MANIKVKNAAGADQTYNGVNKIRVQKSGGGTQDYIIPAGITQITENGTYDVSGYASANVNVPAPAPALEEKTITANGTYTPSSGKDGFSKVIVNVQGGGKVYLHNILCYKGSQINPDAQVSFSLLNNVQAKYTTITSLTQAMVTALSYLNGYFPASGWRKSPYDASKLLFVVYGEMVARTLSYRASGVDNTNADDEIKDSANWYVIDTVATVNVT